MSSSIREGLFRHRGARKSGLLKFIRGCVESDRDFDIEKCNLPLLKISHRIKHLMLYRVVTTNTCAARRIMHLRGVWNRGIRASLETRHRFKQPLTSKSNATTFADCRLAVADYVQEGAQFPDCNSLRMRRPTLTDLPVSNHFL